MGSPSLDPLFFRRLFRLFKILFRNFKSRASVIFYVLTALALLLQFVIYASGLVPSRYFEVLGSKDFDGFKDLAIYSILIIVLNAVMRSTQRYVSRMLYLTWRQALCSKIHRNYFSGMNFYKVNVLDKTLDNIDQRITQDVDKFTREWSVLISRLVVIPFTIVYYSYQCFISTTWIGPVTIYVYFLIGTIINRLIMAPIVRLHVAQEVCEGNFRYQHLNVRTHAEAMAFYQAGATEYHKSENRLGKVLKQQMSLFNWSFWLNSSVNIFDYIGGILSYLVIAIPIFAGTYDHLAPEELSALISRNAFVCIYLIHSFSQLIDMSGTIGDIAAHTHRLGQLLELIDENDAAEESNSCAFENFSFEESAEDSSLITNRLKGDKIELESIPEEPKTYFDISSLTYTTPDGRFTLANNLSFSLSSGQNVLLTGATGCGKTSLLRVLAQIWTAEKGTVEQFVQYGARGVMFLPQTPLMTDGTLFDQIVYPRITTYPEFEGDKNDKRVQSIIEEVGLKDLVENNGGLHGNTELDWSNKLSVGEMQRLSFARLFYHHPDIAVMDEPTSGLSKTTEDQMFLSCMSRKITCLTVAHGINLRKHHDRELRLLGNGEWTFSTLL